MADLVARMPAESIAAGQALAAQMVQLGPAGMGELVRMLLPPGAGDDRQARLALNGLAFYVTRPGAEKERRMFSRVLLEALQVPGDPQVKAFLISLLQQVGKGEAVAPLSQLLSDPELGEPAARALVGIAAPGVVPALLRALPAATGRNRLALIQALGDLRARAAVKAILPYAASEEADLRRTAWYALANIGDPTAAEALAQAARSKDPGERAYATSLTLTLARRLAETGKKEEAAKLCRELLRARRESQVICEVLAVLTGILKQEALEDLLAALGHRDLQVRAAARELLRSLPAKEVTAKLVAQMERSALERRLFLLEALREIGGKEAQQAVLAAARSADPEVRYAAARMASDWLNLAQGKPVATSVPQQGNQAPALAVDGNAGDLASSWWGAAWPAWFQVDLEKPVRIDTVQVFFYWDGQRYYAYTVEVSSDGQTWRPVVDQSRNTQPATPRGTVHRFDPTLARYVRLNILRNSANEAVHLVELKVFAAGTAPPLDLRPPRPKPDREGFIPLFNGRDLTGWVGSTQGYVVEDGVLVCLPEGGGLLRTEEQYSDFILRFEFRLTPNANNGVGLRFTAGNPAYSGMEIQILDDSGDQYRNLQPYQYHGSIYGVVPSKRGHQKPVGEWNSEEIIANGRRITVILNGATIVDADLDQVLAQGPADHQDHPGLQNEKGYIGFLGHGSRVEFRNIRLKELRPPRPIGSGGTPREPEP